MWEQASQIAAQRAHSSSVLQMAGAAAGNAAPALQQHLAFSAALTAMAAAGPVGIPLFLGRAKLALLPGPDPVSHCVDFLACDLTGKHTRLWQSTLAEELWCLVASFL